MTKRTMRSIGQAAYVCSPCRFVLRVASALWITMRIILCEALNPVLYAWALRSDWKRCDKCGGLLHHCLCGFSCGKDGIVCYDCVPLDSLMPPPTSADHQSTPPQPPASLL